MTGTRESTVLVTVRIARPISSGVVKAASPVLPHTTRPALSCAT